MARCNFNRRARSLAEQEVGCPLTHCRNGHHVPDNSTEPCPECIKEGKCEQCGYPIHEGITCDEYAEEHAEEIELREQAREAEAAAGWDAEP